MPIVNDIHSQLNATDMRRIVVPRTPVDIQRAVVGVREEGGSLSVAGGRHAMGGQQFLDGGVLLDARGLKRILELDAERGLVRVEAGMMWDDLIRGLRDMQRGSERRWSIVQKQTGADRLSIGGGAGG